MSLSSENWTARLNQKIPVSQTLALRKERCWDSHCCCHCVFLGMESRVLHSLERPALHSHLSSPACGASDWADTALGIPMLVIAMAPDFDSGRCEYHVQNPHVLHQVKDAQKLCRYAIPAGP